MEISKLIADLKKSFEGKILGDREFRGEHTLIVAPSALVDICCHLKEQCGFDYLLDITSVDHFGEDPRFEIVYELYSMAAGLHLRLSTKVSEDEPEVATVSPLWPTADWHEREIWDMMGIRFKNHPDLRRILMWEGYPYFPLRKDFPLEGKPTDIPEVAFTHTAPLAGGPFVTSPTTGNTQIREPRARRPGDLPTEKTFIAEP
jgi:NADH-quinone oxidoreductase subunit C